MKIKSFRDIYHIIYALSICYQPICLDIIFYDHIRKPCNLTLTSEIQWLKIPFSLLYGLDYSVSGMYCLMGIPDENKYDRTNWAGVLGGKV